MNERDSLQSITNMELKQRIELAECIISEGVKELVGETNLKEVIRQRDLLVSVLKDRDRKKKVKEPENIIVKLKPINLTIIRT